MGGVLVFSPTTMETQGLVVAGARTRLTTRTLRNWGKGANTRLITTHTRRNWG